MLKTMKSRELVPNTKNLYESLINDSIGRGRSALEFVHMLDQINGHYSIALDGQWGSGKTFFVNQIKMILDALNPTLKMSDTYRDGILNWIDQMYGDFPPKRPAPSVSVIFDAWENDSDQDPLLSILNCIEDELHESFDQQLNLNLCHAFEKIVDDIIPPLFKYSIAVITDIAKSVKDATPTSVIKSAHELKSNVHQFIETLTDERGDRLVLFIDELDRCRPDYAIKTLERIKHYLLHDRVTVVFSTNIVQLQHTVCNFYGQQFDAYNYLQRFFDLNVTMPSYAEDEFYKIIDWKLQNDRYSQVCRAVMAHHHLSMRDIIRFSSLSEISEKISSPRTHDFHDMAYKLEFAYIIPVAIGLKITNINKYNQFVSGNAPDELWLAIRDQPRLYRPFFIDVDSSRMTDQDCLKRLCSQLYHAVFCHEYISDEEIVDIGQFSITYRSRYHIRQCLNVLNAYNFN